MGGLGDRRPHKSVSSASFGREQKKPARPVVRDYVTTGGSGAVYGRRLRVSYIGAGYPAFLRVEVWLTPCQAPHVLDWKVSALFV